MNLAEANLPPEVERMVEDELGQEERLLWAGQPLPGRMARSSIPILLFGIPWTGFPLSMRVTATETTPFDSTVSV
jgi:hypothetical protein